MKPFSPHSCNGPIWMNEELTVSYRCGILPVGGQGCWTSRRPSSLCKCLGLEWDLLCRPGTRSQPDQWSIDPWADVSNSQSTQDSKKNTCNVRNVNVHCVELWLTSGYVRVRSFMACSLSIPSIHPLPAKYYEEITFNLSIKI